MSMEKVGKFFMVGFEGTTVTPEVTLLITKYRVGTIMLSGKNFTNALQAKELIRSLQLIAKKSNYEYPIIFVIDEEGGMLNSLFDKEFITQFPGAMTLGATDSEELIYNVYRAMAKELKVIGFSMYLGPVMDILKNTSNALMHQIIGVRSYGYSLEKVVKFSRAAAKAFIDEGMINSGKHFPGYGSATINSNFELPMISESTDQLIKFNIVPYIELNKENLLDTVSVGGCAVPGVNPNDLHACLSPAIVTELLRGTVNFDGAVISECLLLEALDKNFGVVQGCISAFSVGCDLIMLCSNFDIQQQAIEALESVIIDQLIGTERVVKATKRIRKLQQKLPSWNEVLDNVPFLPDEMYYQHRMLSKKAYEKSITVVRDAGLPITKHLTPFSENDNTVLLLTPLIQPLYETVDRNGVKSHINNVEFDIPQKSRLKYGEDVFIALGKMLADYKPGYKFYHTSYNSNGLTSFHEELILKSKVLLFFSAETTNNLYQVGVSKHVSMLCNAPSPRVKKGPGSGAGSGITNRAMIIISVSSPTDFLYDINIGGSPTGYICTYDYTINALSNLPKILFGDFKAVGKIPGLSNGSQSLSDTKTKQTPASWLVECFNFARDFENLIKLLMNNGLIDHDTKPENMQGLRRLYMDTQGHRSYVVRNTSSKTIMGVSTTWVYNSTPDTHDEDGIANLVLLLVDKNKRKISIGTHLYTKTMKYLMKEKHCSKVYLCKDFPKISLRDDLLLTANEDNTKTLSFFKTLGWDFSTDNLITGLKFSIIKKRRDSSSSTEYSNNHYIGPNVMGEGDVVKEGQPDKLTQYPLPNDVLHRPVERKLDFLMRLENISNWQVAENLVRQLQVVGIMFDICRDPGSILTLHPRNESDDPGAKSWGSSPYNKQPTMNENNSEIYLELYNDLNAKQKQYFDGSGNVDIIVALEPTKKSIVGSVVVFNNHSKFTKFYPFLDQCKLKDNSKYACITGHFIDPLYSTLSEVFKLGLICTALMYIRAQYKDVSECFITDVDEKQVNSLKDNGFEVVQKYSNYYSVISDQ